MTFVVARARNPTLSEDTSTDNTQNVASVPGKVFNCLLRQRVDQRLKILGRGFRMCGVQHQSCVEEDLLSRRP